MGYEMENTINMVAEMVEFFKTPLCLVIQGNVDGLYSIDKVYNVELLTPLFFFKD